MSSFLYLAGRRAVKARKLVVLVWVSVLAVLGGLVFLNMGSLDNSVEIPGTESGDALEQLAATFPQVAGASAQIVVTGPGVVDEGDSAQAINNGPVATCLALNAGLHTGDRVSVIRRVASTSGQSPLP